MEHEVVVLFNTIKYEALKFTLDCIIVFLEAGSSYYKKYIYIHMYMYMCMCTFLWITLLLVWYVEKVM